MKKTTLLGFTMLLTFFVLFQGKVFSQVQVDLSAPSTNWNSTFESSNSITSVSDVVLNSITPPPSSRTVILQKDVVINNLTLGIETGDIIQIDLNGHSLTINNLIIAYSGSIFNDGSGGIVTIKGDVTTGSPSNNVSLNFTNSEGATINGSIDLTNSSLQTFTTGANTVNVGGDFSMSAGTLNATDGELLVGGDFEGAGITSVDGKVVVEGEISNCATCTNPPIPPAVPVSPWSIVSVLIGIGVAAIVKFRFF